MADRMRALAAERYGGPEVLQLREVPVPVPGEGELLVRVAASTVNRTDTATLRGYPFLARLFTGFPRPRFDVFGHEFAGTVEGAGDSVTRFAPGDRVFGLSPDRFGTHAEFVAVPADGAVARVPDGHPLIEAVVAEGAWYAEGSVRDVVPGQEVLIYGASGAIGIAALQLARDRGARVTAVVGPRHLDLMRELGADSVIDYTTGTWSDLDTRFDLVMDAVGKTSYFACRHLLKPGGGYRATDLGPRGSNVWLGLWSGLTRSGRVALPLPTDAPGFVTRLAGLMAAGRFRGVFDRAYPFEQIADAYAYVETGQKTGIVVIDMGPTAEVRRLFDPDT